MKPRSFGFILVLSFVCLGADGPRLRLKEPVSERDVPETSRRLETRRAARQLDAWRRHVVIRFDRAPTSEDLNELRRRGARLVAPIPDDGALFSAPVDIDLAGIPGRAVRIAPHQKLSPVLAERGPEARYLVEFYPDVQPSQMREIVLREGLVFHEHPDLRQNHLMVEGPVPAVKRLAEWDEVAYIFPASRELARGEPVFPCRGAVTAGGMVGQYIATVGPGWDGYGQNSARLTYSYQALSDQLPEYVVRRELEKAMRMWSEQVRVTFAGGGYPNAKRNINYLFARGNYGSPYPFDGPGKILAQTFYPSPPNPEPIAGDVHFDDDEPWNIGARIDLFSVALHELGHALGLGHSDDSRDVMYPYYRQVTGLSEGDIAAVRTLYASSEPTAPVAPLELEIQSPASESRTASSWVRVAGSASGGVAPLQVTWTSDQGLSGRAQGAEQWTVGYVPLRSGQNTITVTVTDARGARFSKYVTVERLAPEPPPTPPTEPVNPENPAPPPPGNPPTSPTSDQTAPTLRLLNPTSTTFLTRSSSIVLRGTASDNVGVVAVRWTSNTGSQGTARGTSFWQTSPIPLRHGMNILLVHAYDAAGNHSWRSVMVIRR